MELRGAFSGQRCCHKVRAPAPGRQSMSERVVPPAARQRRRPTKPGVVLSEELIVDTALRLIEEHGADALSVRRLGRALGADPSSLYRYFRHTDHPMLAIADELI